jgi:transposase
MKFGLVYPTDLEDVTGNNSGIDYQKNYDLQELEMEIDKLIKDAKEYYYSSNMTQTVLRQFRNKTFLRLDKYSIEYNTTEYSERQIKEILKKQHDSFNEPIVWLLQEWLRVSYNPELKFEGRLLEQLGFKNCPVCYPEYDSALRDNEFQVRSPSPMPPPKYNIEPDDLPF